MVNYSGDQLCGAVMEKGAVLYCQQGGTTRRSLRYLLIVVGGAIPPVRGWGCDCVGSSQVG